MLMSLENSLEEKTGMKKNEKERRESEEEKRERDKARAEEEVEVRLQQLIQVKVCRLGTVLEMYCALLCI